MLVEAKMTKLKLVPFWAHHEKTGFFGKDNNARKKQKAAGKEENQL